MGIRYPYGLFVGFMGGVIVKFVGIRYPYGGNRWIVGIYLISAVFSPFYRYLRRI